MRATRFPKLFGVLMAALLASSCGEPESGTEQRSGKPTVYAVNDPLAYFAERIGGSLIDVEFPAPADVDPAFWRPAAATIGRFQKADVILLNGADYAKWVKQASLPDSKTVDTTAAVTEKFIEVKDAVTHQHGPQGEHSHAGTAFTTWLDPTMAVAQAKAVRDALTKLLPDEKATFEKNYQKLEKDLLALDQRLKTVFAAEPQRPLLGSHPVYQYLAARYKLNFQSVHWEPDTVPDEEAWKAFGELLAKHPATVMLWEGPPAKETVARLKTLGVQAVVFNPCGNRSEEGDYLEVMRKNAERLEAALR
jgi:zinc transport system substrate-binding protein